MSKLKIEYRSIDDLKPYERNARTHDMDQIAKLVASIESFGFTNPILLDGDNGVLAGHGRLAAARMAGLREVPTIQLAHLSDTEKRAYILADNRLALDAGWDASLLTLELRDLQIDDFDLTLTGFSEDELELYLADPEEANEGNPSEENGEPYEGEPRTQRGDIWICGRHRIGCGDSGSREFVDVLLNGESPDLVYCDPPYGIDVGSLPMGNAPKKNFGKVKQADYGENEWDKEIPYGAIELATQLCDKVVLWGGNYFADRLPASSCWLVWDKENGENFFADCELAWTSLKKAVRLFQFRWQGMLQGDMKNKETRIHPTQKPVALHKWAFEELDAGEVVVDLFAGSGSTMIACELTDRVCLTCDITPKYVDSAIHRWQQLTGEVAVHSITGERFSEAT